MLVLLTLHIMDSNMIVLKIAQALLGKDVMAKLSTGKCVAGTLESVN